MDIPSEHNFLAFPWNLGFDNDQYFFLQQDSEDTCSVDELASERDETESEVASVSDAKDISDMEQDDGDEGGYHKMVEDSREHSAAMRRSRGRTSSNLSGGMVLSPNSPTLSVGRLVVVCSVLASVLIWGRGTYFRLGFIRNLIRLQLSV